MFAKKRRDNLYFFDKAFKCPHCAAFAEMEQYLLCIPLEHGGGHALTDIAMTTCVCCRKNTYWFLEKTHEPTREQGVAREVSIPHMVFPQNAVSHIPHNEMPENCKNIYFEAAMVSGISPRSASALLRLCLQLLLAELGGKGKNINSDIQVLVQAGLPVEIQQALDAIRIFGNESVHAGEIILNEDKNILPTLFECINMIVENRIAQPKRISKLHDLLPPDARAAINKRDEKR